MNQQPGKLTPQSTLVVTQQPAEEEFVKQSIMPSSYNTAEEGEMHAVLNFLKPYKS